MTVEQREKLLDLHRSAMKAQSAYLSHAGTATDMFLADDSFRGYLFSLEVSA